MGQAQHRAVLIVEDDAELRSLTAALFEDESCARNAADRRA
jgi:hypothetical protein